MIRNNTRFMPVQPQAENKVPNEQLAQIRKAAEGYEKIFLQQIMKSMRATVNRGDSFIKQNMGEKIFQGELDNEYVKQWSKKGGVGFADMVYDQIISRYGAQLGLKSETRPQGPIPFNEKVPPKVINDENGTTIQIPVDKQGVPSTDVRSPWDGRVINHFQTRDNQQVLKIAHPNGVESTLMFQGRLLGLVENSPIKGGDVMAHLSPAAQSVIWNVKS